MEFEWREQTTKKTEFLEITSQINECILQSKVKNGFCVVYCPHATAGIISTENADRGLILDDLAEVMEKVAPENKHYRHSDGNAHAHIKASLVGNSKAILIKNGQLLLGTWEGIFLAEFDGARSRRIVLSVIET